jgi:hypothetical protein
MHAELRTLPDWRGVQLCKQDAQGEPKVEDENIMVIFEKKSDWKCPESFGRPAPRRDSARQLMADPLQLPHQVGMSPINISISYVYRIELPSFLVHSRSQILDIISMGWLRVKN